MRSNGIRAWMVLAAILPLPLTVLAAQEATSLSIDRSLGETGVIQAQAQEQSPRPLEQLFSLRNGVTIRLSGDWGPDPYDRTPTPPALGRQAPREINFSEFLNLQNLKEHSLFKLASSNNPFEGRDQRELDAQMHEPPSSGRGLLNYLSYFFFPPPLRCVEQALADYRRSISDGKSDEDADISIAANCQYLPTLPEFYSAELSHGLVFGRVSGLETVDSTWGNSYLPRVEQVETNGLVFSRVSGLETVDSNWGQFYLPTVEQVETNGLTFFVYEAQGQEQLTLATARHFNLPEDFQGMQLDFFWAIGAPSPFPFMVDPTHRNAPLIHVVYAGTDLGGNQRPVFMKLLQKVTVPGIR